MLVGHKTYQRQSLFLVFFVCTLVASILIVRLGYLMLTKADYYGVKAKELHERERTIKAERGKILDRNGNVLAGNVSVSTISVIHSQVKEPEKVISVLSKELGIEEAEIRKKVEKISSREKIKSNVEKEISDRIRAYKLAGVTVDEDYKRYYEYGTLASKVLGFTGGDNQGIVGLEVSYESLLKGLDGSILTMATAGGVEIRNGAEDRKEPIAGWNLTTTLDLNVMEYATQVANKLLEQKQAKTVEIIIMNPQNGEIYAYTLVNGKEGMSEKEKMTALNAMWRNLAVSDTYEPGSTFKVVTAAAALDKGVVKMTDTFSCPGYKVVEDRRIRCHKTTGHGAETFEQGIMNSCNPVFMEVGARVGVAGLFEGMKKFGILEKTGIDVPGEAATIMHKQENVGAVELATMSFGQSFQLSPIRMLTSVCMIINGGKKITPHFGMYAVNSDKTRMKKMSYSSGKKVLDASVSEEVRKALEKVVSEGGGKKAGVDGYFIGGKTGTSQKLPRGNGKYIASCIGFSPVDNPSVIAMVRIDEPQGLYYGGVIAAPAISTLYTNILPYLLKE